MLRRELLDVPAPAADDPRLARLIEDDLTFADRLRLLAELAESDAAVTIWDRHGRYSGGGFRYHVGEGRFQLLDGASVTQQ